MNLLLAKHVIDGVKIEEEESKLGLSEEFIGGLDIFRWWKKKWLQLFSRKAPN